MHLKAALDWKSWLTPLEFSWKGIASTSGTPSVCHSKRFLARKDIDSIRKELLIVSCKPKSSCYSLTANAPCSFDCSPQDAPKMKTRPEYADGFGTTARQLLLYGASPCLAAADSTSLRRRRDPCRRCDTLLQAVLELDRIGSASDGCIAAVVFAATGR